MWGEGWGTGVGEGRDSRKKRVLCRGVPRDQRIVPALSVHKSSFHRPSTHTRLSTPNPQPQKPQTLQPDPPPNPQTLHPQDDADVTGHVLDILAELISRGGGLLPADIQGRVRDALLAALMGEGRLLLRKKALQGLGE